jgi:hypothetical protein
MLPSQLKYDEKTREQAAMTEHHYCCKSVWKSYFGPKDSSVSSGFCKCEDIVKSWLTDERVEH